MQGTSMFNSAADEFTYQVPSEVDQTYKVSDTPEVDLNRFFERPILIEQFNWGPGNILTEDFNPWILFFEQKRVINRVANYNLMRAKLHIKFIINGNGWYYGIAMANYWPLQSADYFDLNRPLINADLVQASQKPKVLLNPTTNQGGTLSLPFFWLNNYLNIPFSQWQNLGIIQLRSIQELRHANNVTKPLTISVFAWATDVELAVPTHNTPGTISPQSGMVPSTRNRTHFGYESRVIASVHRMFHNMVCPASRADVLIEVFGDSDFDVRTMSYWEALALRDYLHMYRRQSPVSVLHPSEWRHQSYYRPQAGMADEYGTGVVSKPASALARAAGMLSDVPWIGPYMRATQIAASLTSTIATAFGYSRPCSVEPVRFYKQRPAGDIATASGQDTSIKLAFDPKNELTIDSRTVGLAGEDEMDIRSICSRESYLTSFTWPVASSAGLFQVDVTPMMYRSEPVFGSSLHELHFTPCAFAAIPFRFWRGTMRFRFQIVASNYHKGRLRIVYDPSLFFEDPDYNTTYNFVVDIEETKDFTVEVGWGQDSAWKPIAPPGTSTPDSPAPSDDVEPFQKSTPTRGNQAWANGILRVQVLNELTVPSETTPPVEVNVWVSACDDMQFANPTNRIERYSYFRPQSGEVAKADGENTDEANKPDIKPAEHTMATPMPKDDHYNEVFMGEDIRSFRTLLKRYCYHSSLDCNDAYGVREWTVSNFPWYKGYAPGAITPVDTGTRVFNFSYMTYLNYLTPAFCGWRGAIRWKIVRASGQGPNTTGMLSVIRASDDNVYSQLDRPRLTTAANDVVRANYVLRSAEPSMSGGAITTYNTTDCLEYELPYYEPTRFFYARQANFTGNARPSHLITHKAENNAAWDDTLCRYVAAGEDFSLFFFLGAPVMYVNVGFPVN